MMSLLITGIFSACEPDSQDTTDDPRDQFTGLWRFSEANTLKSTKAQNYIVNITKSDSIQNEVILSNFGNPGANDIYVVGKVSSKTIILESQLLTNLWIVSGSGSISNTVGTEMTWSYNIQAGGDKEYFTATATRP